MSRAWDSEDWEAQGRQEFAGEVADSIEQLIISGASMKDIVKAVLAQCVKETEKKI